MIFFNHQKSYANSILERIQVAEPNHPNTLVLPFILKKNSFFHLNQKLRSSTSLIPTRKKAGQTNSFNSPKGYVKGPATIPCQKRRQQNAFN